jgi:hypothetical protein
MNSWRVKRVLYSHSIMYVTLKNSDAFNMQVKLWYYLLFIKSFCTLKKYYRYIWESSSFSFSEENYS